MNDSPVLREREKILSNISPARLEKLLRNIQAQNQFKSLKRVANYFIFKINQYTMLNLFFE